MTFDHRGIVAATVLGAAAVERRQGEWPDEPESAPVFAEFDIYELDEAMLEAKRLAQAARWLERWLEGLAVADLQEHGTIRIGDQVLVARPNRKRVLINADGLADYLGADWKPAVRLGDNVRITAVRALAQQRGDDPAAIEDTFYEWQGTDDYKVERLHLGAARTPQWAKRIGQGERVRRH